MLSGVGCQLCVVGCLLSVTSHVERRETSVGFITSHRVRPFASLRVTFGHVERRETSHSLECYSTE